MEEIQDLVERRNSLERVKGYTWFYLKDKYVELQKYIDNYCEVELEKIDKRLNKLLK